MRKWFTRFFFWFTIWLIGLYIPIEYQLNHMQKITKESLFTRKKTKIGCFQFYLTLFIIFMVKLFVIEGI